MEHKFYSIPELSKILGLHPKTVLRFIHEGKISAAKIGRTWRVSEESLKEYCHGELAGKESPAPAVNYDTLGSRISVSAVVEINEQNSEEASRLSNSMMAMLNGERSGQSRFDYFYYPEIQKAKYVFYGSPDIVSRILESFAMLCDQKGEQNE